MAVPSSPDPDWPEITLALALRSPLALEVASEFTPSDITPILIPLPPLVGNVERAVSARWVRSPSEVTEPVLVIASTAGAMKRTSDRAAISSKAATGTHARIALNRAKL